MKKLLLLSITLLALTVACGESKQDIKVAELENKITELDEIVAKLDRRATELEIDLICSEQGQQARHFPWFKNDDASLLKNIVCVERARYINKKFLEEYKNIDTPKRVLNYLSKVKGSTDLEVAQEIMRQMLVNDYVDVFVKK